LKNILVLCFSDLPKDPRVSRQIAFLSKHFRVTAAGYADPQVEGVEFVPVEMPFWSRAGKFDAATMIKLGLYERGYWSSRSVKSASRSLAGRSFDLIVANDINTLPLALRLRQTARILFDAHEYSPREFEESRKWRFFLRAYNEHLCRTCIPSVDAMTTVCEGLAEEYRRNYAVNPIVILNTPPYANITPVRGAEDKIRVVHHGAAIPSRRLEQMLEMVPHLDERFCLDLMLVPSVPRYMDKLAALASRIPRTRLLAPVSQQQVVAALNQYDVGIYLLEPNNFNNLHSLPNKFFEFIQARLAIAIGPSPEMTRFVKQFDCGIVSETFDPLALASQINGLTSQKIDYFKQHSDVAAKTLCFEKATDLLLDVITRTLAAH
jgi:hypothetical protein